MKKNAPKHVINQFLYAWLIKTLNYSFEFHDRGPLKDCGAAYVHWPVPPAASLKMWSPAEQSSQSHPGGHPPVAEDTAVTGCGAAYVHGPGARAASLLPDGGTILMSPLSAS